MLAERHRVRPRQAFEQLRSAARGRGQRVIDIAGEVVASATNPLLPLPEELSRPAWRRARGPGASAAAATLSSASRIRRRAAHRSGGQSHPARVIQAAGRRVILVERGVLLAARAAVARSAWVRGLLSGAEWT